MAHPVYHVYHAITVINYSFKEGTYTFLDSLSAFVNRLAVIGSKSDRILCCLGFLLPLQSGNHSSLLPLSADVPVLVTFFQGIENDLLWDLNCCPDQTSMAIRDRD